MDGLSKDAVAALLQIAANSPMAAAVAIGFWLISRVLKHVLETKSDAMIRAILALSMAIRNATAPEPIQQRQRTGRRNKTDPQALMPPP